MRQAPLGRQTLAPRSALIALALVSTSAWAQVPPITVSSQPYQPLTAGTVVAPLNGDDVGVLVPLGFTFPYFGQNYTHVMLNSNGVIVPGVSNTTTCSTGCLTNSAFPSTGSPNPAIAAFWDDLDLRTSGSVRTLQTPGQFTVEYVNVPRYSSPAATVTFQIRLSAAGSLSFHYGSLTGSGSTWTASAGFENPLGTLGANLLTACTTSCTNTHFPPSGTLFTVGEPNGPDLAVSSVTIANFVTETDGNLTFTVSSTLRNFGRASASNFLWRAYLSRDQVLDLTPTDGGADIEVAEGGPDSLPGVDGGVTLDGGLAIIAVTASAQTMTPPATGEYYVLVQVDPTDVVMEASETNNVGATSTAFVQGVDLVATGVSGPLSTGGGSLENFSISFFNRGTTPAGNVGFRILLSTDQILDPSDFTLFNGNRTVSGGQTITETIPVTIPANAPSGQFHFLLQLDPANGVLEANEANNVAASVGKVDVRRADLVAEQVSFLDAVTGRETTSARFGDPVQLRVRFRNIGGATANNFRVALVVSTDSSLSLLSDTYVCDQVQASIAPSTASTETTLSCSLPLTNATGVGFGTGQYFLFGVVDSTGAVFETNKSNNSLMLGPIRVSAPGVDLAVTSVSGPASAGVGELVPIVRTLRNLGNVDAPAVGYRYYASANDIITAADVPLRIVENGAGRDEGSVTLARGAAETRTELVRLPGTMTAGTYHVGCIVDPALSVASELDATNNALASSSIVVAASSLRVVNTALPDAVVGRPYAFRLAAVGEQGPSTWRIEPLLGGAPPWLSIGASDGLLSGTPDGSNGSEVVGLTVIVANGGRESAVRLALRVMPTTSALAITTSALPAVVNSSLSQYRYMLGAAGGVGPYAWRVAAGTLPQGLVLGADGSLTGAPRGASNGAIPLSFEVRDAVGGRAQRQLPLRLIAPGAIGFRTVFIPDALVGQEYLQDIGVANQDGSPLTRPLTWSVTGAVPGGLTITPQAELITVAGRATQSGTFTFTLSVEDRIGRTDTLDFTLTVHPPRYRVQAALPEVLHPTEVVSLPLKVSPNGVVTYRLAGGVLPPGLSLAPAGTIDGTVAAERSEGQWAFVVEVRDASGMSGLTPLSLRVERLPRAQGCSTATVWVPWALLAVALRRRRSFVTS